ncbi:MAG TPA: aldehyde dehydrogenase family protein [Candidatus Kapabacteria bacterium]|nr:aldehyde dehydrogenase family protein [Candidatus Kapabacteria bacterium]
MLKDIKLLINNAHNTSQEYLEVKSPYSNETLAKLIKPSPEEVELAFNNSFNSIELMKNIPPYKRADILYYVADKIKQNHEELAQLISLEGGKPLKDARIEVSRAINTVKFSGDEALRVHGNQINMDMSAKSEQHLAFTIKEPIGVVLAISAFNHPINLICHQVSTAIAAGNPIIIKPSEKTPLSAYKIANYFLEAGVAPNAISLLPLEGNETSKIISDKRLSFVSFIGSSKVGWQIPKLIASGVAYALEHGGTAVAVVDESCDIEYSVNSIVKGAFYHAGQVCVSTQNVYIAKSIYADFKKLIVQKTAELLTGDPNNEFTDVGPIITQYKLQQILNDIDQAISMGANKFIGGDIIDNNCISPTILENTNMSMNVMKDEIFGPVVNINPFEDLDKVVQLANASPFAFQNAIYTSDINRALSFAKKIRSKAVIINDSTAFRVDWMPFGGFADSGFGVGGIKYSIDDLVREKLIIMKHLL